MTFEKPTEKFPTTDEAIRWFIKAHFGPTKDPTRKTWASDLYATYLSAAAEVELPLVSSSLFGRALSTMLASSMAGRKDEGERRSGRLYDVEPLEGVALFELGRAGKGAVHELYRKALQRVGASAPQSTTQEALARENDHFVMKLARRGYLSTLPRGRKRAGVEAPPNEVRVKELATVELHKEMEGAAPGYIRWLTLLEANFVVWRTNHGSRKKVVAIEHVEVAS